MTTRPDRFTWHEGDLVLVDDDDNPIGKAGWDESKHPRHPRGSERGGEFAAADGEWGEAYIGGEKRRVWIPSSAEAEASAGGFRDLPSEWGKRGYYTHSPQFRLPRVMDDVDFYSRSGEKLYGRVVAIGENQIKLKDHATDKVHTFQLRTDTRKPFIKDDDIADSPFTITATIEKFDEDKRLVTGWASIVEKDGEQVLDRQDDTLTEDEIVKAAHAFMELRAGKSLHAGSRIGDIVESVVFTKDLQQKLGIDLGKVGWLITMKVHDDDVWDQVKKGELVAFSIGGRGIRELIEDDAG